MTYSIVAKDPATGAFGVGTATGGPAVGSLVPHARAGVGAVATQGYTTNPHYGFRGLELLATDVDAETVLDQLTRADEGRTRRQCVLIDAKGRTAAWTGSEITEVRGSILRPGVAVAGNMLVGEEVLGEMLRTYEESADKPFAHRMLAALEAAEAAGGDKRGTRSGALRVYETERYPAIDVRADWSLEPIADLGEILTATLETDYAEFFARLPTEAEPSRA